MNNKFASLGTALSRDEAKKVMGRKMASDGAVCSCSCSGTAGTWEYTGGTQPSNQYLNKDIKNYCGSYGGSCTGCTNWSTPTLVN